MQTSALPIEAECYPLSKPMISRLAVDRGIPLAVSTQGVTSLLLERNPADASLKNVKYLLRDIDALREKTSEILAPALTHPTLLTTDWFRETLKEHTPSLMKKGKTPTQRQDVELFSEKTLSLWRSRGLLLSDERDVLNFHTATAVLIMRLADRRRERGFLPPGNHNDEPFMYVWRQDGPQSPAIPCGLPLGEDIPKHSFLFTRWQALGALKQGGWLPFANLGSVRWRGIREEQGSLLWDMSEQDIALWDPTLVPLGKGILDSVAPLTRHTLATMILLKQASLALQSNTVPTSHA